MDTKEPSVYSACWYTGTRNLCILQLSGIQVPVYQGELYTGTRNLYTFFIYSSFSLKMYDVRRVACRVSRIACRMCGLRCVLDKLY